MGAYPGDNPGPTIGDVMQWLAAALPLTVAAACTAAFFLAGRESRTSDTPASPGSPSPTPPDEPFLPNPPQTWTTPGQSWPISVEWKTPTSSPRSPASLPIRHLARPLPASGSTSSEAEETLSPKATAEEGSESTPAPSA